MTTRIPREERVAWQVQFVDEVRHAARMFMAAMKQEHGAQRGGVDCWPVSIEERLVVMCLEM